MLMPCLVCFDPNFSFSDLIDDAADVAQEEQYDQEVEQELVPVLFPRHLHDALLRACRRLIGLINFYLGWVDQMALVFKFAVGVDHNFVRFHGRALDPSYLIVGFV